MAGSTKNKQQQSVLLPSSYEISTENTITSLDDGQDYQEKIAFKTLEPISENTRKMNQSYDQKFVTCA